MSGAAGATETPAGAATETVTKTWEAAERGDVSAFLDSDRAARSGAKPETVTRQKQDPAKPAAGAQGRPNAKPAAGKDGAQAKGPSAADADADARLVTRIREAVDTATAESTRRIQELEHRLEEARRPAQPAAGTPGAPAGEAPKKDTPAYKRYMAMDDAPKAEDFDTVTEYHAAVTVHINTKMAEESAAAARTGAADHAKATRSIERIQGFHGRINEFKTANPELLIDGPRGKALPLSQDVGRMHGYDTLREVNQKRQAQGLAPLPATIDHAIAEEVYDSDIPGAVAVFLSVHPEELEALRACKTPRALLKAYDKMEDKARAAYVKAGDDGDGAGDDGDTTTTTTTTTTPAAIKEKAAAAVDRSVSKAKPPAPEVGKAGTKVDPMKRAIETGDVGMFLALDRDAMAERRGIKR